MATKGADAATPSNTGTTVLPDVLRTTATGAASLPITATQFQAAERELTLARDGGGVLSDSAIEEARGRDEDAAALNALLDDLEAHIAVDAVADPVGATNTVARSFALAVMDRVIQATGELAILDPVAGARVSASLLLHKALAVPQKDPLPTNAATILLQRSTRLDDPAEVLRAVLRRRDLTDDQRTQLYGPSPDADDPLVQATLAALADADDTETHTPVPLTALQVTAAVTAPNPVRLGKEFRSAMFKVRRWFSRLGGQLDKPTDKDGQLAHTIIGLHYLTTHLDHPVLIDRFAWTPYTAALDTLANTAGNDPLFARIQTWLVSATTGFVGQPDILDLQTREVYEIKPLHRIFDGAAQLAARYLLPLNTAVLGTELLARALITAFSPAGGLPHGWAQAHPNLRPFLPGSTWYPSQVYPLPDGRFMFAARVVPGVIGYQIVGEEKGDPDGPSLADLENRLFAALAALAVMAGATLAGMPGDYQAGGGRVLSPVGRYTIDLTTLREIARIFNELLPQLVLFSILAAILTYMGVSLTAALVLSG